MTARERLSNRRACATFPFQCNGLTYIATVSRYGDGRLADSESRCGHDWGKQAFEPFASLRQLRGHARGRRMHFRTNVMGDETHDSLAVGGSQSFASVRQTFCESVDPQATVRIEHHLDDRGVLKPRTDRRPERAP